MNKSAKLLDNCKKKLLISSTYKLSQITGITESKLSEIYSGKHIAGIYECFKIAEILEIDPAYVIAEIKSESEKNDKKREYFRTFHGTSRKIAASIMLAVVLGTGLVSALPRGSDFNALWRVFLKRCRFV
jgi:hypothetical protein